MKTIAPLTATLLAALLFNGCSAPAGPKALFLDVHELGAGQVTAAAVAEAHRKDLAVEGRHGVRFLDYWVDAAHGTVYCLSEAPDAHSIADTHREAHGLLPNRILAVSGGAAAAPAGHRKLFIDSHQLGAGNVSAAAVAAAHQKDLATQRKYGVNFLNYWVDEANGTVVCLSEAPDAAAVTETHREAHGLLPTSVVEVTPAK